MTLNNRTWLTEFGAVAGGVAGLAAIVGVGVLGGKEVADHVYSLVNEAANTHTYLSQIDPDALSSQAGRYGIGMLFAIMTHKINPIGYLANAGEKAFMPKNNVSVYQR